MKFAKLMASLQCRDGFAPGNNKKILFGTCALTNRCSVPTEVSDTEIKGLAKEGEQIFMRKILFLRCRMKSCVAKNCQEKKTRC